MLSPELFASKFILHNEPPDPFPNDSRFIPDNSFKDAAVLVPIVVRNNQLSVLLTQRAAHLRHHPGQISFPGGRKDQEDINLIATALRESEEEIGLNPNSVSILGMLPKHPTISNYTVYPVVGLIHELDSLQLNQDEVAEAFEVPLEHFLTRKSHFTVRPQFKNGKHRVHFMPYKNKLIWGATGAILDKLIRHLE